MKKNKRDELAAQEVTVDEISQPAEDKKKMSKLKKLSIIWTVLTFLIYVAIDVNNIVKEGWTVLNIIVTVFLGLQILLYAIFTLIGSKDKKQQGRQKAAMKYVKKTKKISVKLLTVVTSIAMIIGVESVNFADVVAIIFAIISLLLAILSLAMLIRKRVRQSKKEKSKRQKLQAKQDKKQKPNDNE